MRSVPRVPSLSLARATRSAIALALLLAGCGAPAARPATLSFATAPAPDLTRHAAAVVRLRTQDGSAVLTRSGVVVDPRGYVLTSFASVGVIGTRARGGARPGTLFGGGEDIRVEVFEGPSTVSTTEYVGRVVRGDLRLNLALVRIVGSADGPLEPTRFASVELGDDVETPSLWGADGWILGASGVLPALVARRTNAAIALTNSEARLSGYLLADWESSLEGAPYYDAEGRFAGIHMAGFVRPGSRVPRAWRDALAQGELDDRVVEGIVALTPGEWADIAPIGDSAYGPSAEDPRGGGETQEEFVFSVPSARSGTFTVEPPLPVTAYQRGRALQGGTGEIFIPAEQDVYVVVRFPRASDPRGLRLRVRFATED